MQRGMNYPFSARSALYRPIEKSYAAGSKDDQSDEDPTKLNLPVLSRLLL